MAQYQQWKLIESKTLNGECSFPTEIHDIGCVTASGGNVRITIPVQIANSNSVYRTLPVSEAYLLEAAPGAVIEEHRARCIYIPNDDIYFAIAVHVADRDGIGDKRFLT